MKFLNKRPFHAKLSARFPEPDGGWLYNGFTEVYGNNCYTISARAKLDTLVRKTLNIPSVLGSQYPLFAFPDAGAGWKGFHQRYRWSPIELSDEADLSRLLHKHLYFREPGQRRHEDNYHITDSSFLWVAVFCHHDNWHFFSSPKATMKVRAI
jgi:hypothetical protein